DRPASFTELLAPKLIERIPAIVGQNVFAAGRNGLLERLNPCLRAQMAANANNWADCRSFEVGKRCFPRSKHQVTVVGGLPEVEPYLLHDIIKQLDRHR